MRNTLGWVALGVAVVVLYHFTPISPALDEALGGSWWWWLLVAALTVFVIWRDLRSARKPPENRRSEPR
jgi:FtsH-binding integral membrane protein